MIEFAVRSAAALAPSSSSPPEDPRSIFVLRNNDLGDLLVITPLFEALRRRFPRTRIVAGVGSWAAPILEGNPHIDEVRIVNAPWHNGSVRPQGLLAALRYIVSFSEPSTHDIGIDVLGSPFGSLLLMRAGIPFRLGVRGYAGGHSSAMQCVAFDPNEHVGRAALRFAELLGATDLPENRPQLFLSSTPPISDAIVFAPGGGYAEKCWSLDRFATLARLLSDHPIKVIGGPSDRDAGARLADGCSHVSDLTGKLSLRESFSVIASARAVVCNSSVAMHAAAAFRRPAFVALGPALSDARQHAAQWGYPESRILTLPTPEEAHAHIEAMIGATP